MKAKIALKNYHSKNIFKLRVDWRLSWYSVMIWLLAVVVAGFVILPWFYLALPIVLFLMTTFYFRPYEYPELSRSGMKQGRKDGRPVQETSPFHMWGGRHFKRTDKSLKMGIWVSLIWFLVVAVLDFLEIIGPNFNNLAIYFADFRNWLKFPLILLIPVIYSMVLESKNAQRPLKNRPGIV